MHYRLPPGCDRIIMGVRDPAVHGANDGICLRATRNKVGKMGFINFVTRVSPDCDCFPWSDHPIVPDVGILASKDPLALDKACYDLVNKQRGYQDTKLKGGWEPGEDKFLGMRPKVDARIQFTYGEKLGLGTADYELIEI